LFAGFLFAFLWLGGWIGGSAYGLVLLTGIPNWSQRAATLTWAVPLMMLFAIPLLLRRLNVFAYLHRVLTVFAVLTFALCCLVVFSQPAVRGQIGSFFASSVRLDFSAFASTGAVRRADLITAIVFMGMGGFACVMYTNLSLLARYGMAGARTPDGRYVLDYLAHDTGQTADAALDGALATDDTQSERNLVAWTRRMWFETAGGVLGNWLTTAMLALLAFTLLYNTGNVPAKDWDLLSAQSAFFEPIFGAWAMTIFVMLATAFLLDTWIGFGTLWAQMSAEAVRSIFPSARRISARAWFKLWVGVLLVSSVLTLCVQAPGDLIRLTAVCQLVATPILCALLYYLNHVHLPRIGPAWYRPNALSRYLIVLTGLLYLVLVAWYFFL